MGADNIHIQLKNPTIVPDISILFFFYFPAAGRTVKIQNRTFVKNYFAEKKSSVLFFPQLRRIG